MNTTNGSITTHIENKIATITFSHPSSNSFPSFLLDDLTIQLNVLSENNDVAIVVLKSEGEAAFCAGASFDELLAVNDFETGKKFFSGFANVINAMRKCTKLIVGRVQGKAVGGGVGLVSACDYVFATESASVKLSEIAIGIGPFVIEPSVSRKIGKSAMAEMTLNPTEWKSAQWAKTHKLFTEVFSTIEEMDNTLAKFVNQLASYNPEALCELKKVLWEGTDEWDELLYERAAISGKLVLSDFTKEALNAFKKK